MMRKLLETCSATAVHSYVQAVLAEHVYSAELHGVVVAPQLEGLWLDVLLLQVCDRAHLVLVLSPCFVGQRPWVLDCKQ